MFIVFLIVFWVAIFLICDLYIDIKILGGYLGHKELENFLKEYPLERSKTYRSRNGEVHFIHWRIEENFSEDKYHHLDYFIDRRPGLSPWGKFYISSARDDVKRFIGVVDRWSPEHKIIKGNYIQSYPNL